MKKLVLGIYLFTILFFLPFPVFAQQMESNTVSTRVGNPPVSTVTDGGSILEWDTKIVNQLQPGAAWGLSFFNRLTENIGNGTYNTGTWAGSNDGTVYWCTYSIVDSYNLAGITGLSKSAHGAVVNMRRFWQNAGGNYVYVPASATTIHHVHPSYAVFMEQVAGVHTGSEHVAMVKEISVDPVNGNGYIITQDSNSSAKTRKFPVYLGVVQNTPYPVRGFGGVN
jgi:hypothetical protein